MKKLFTLFICLIYTFVTFGGSIFMHNCGESTTLSIYEKSNHDKCSLCNTAHKETKQANKSCHTGSCKDIEIKIDQLSDKLFSSSKAEKFLLQPIIFQRLWVELTPFLNPALNIVSLSDFDFQDIQISPPHYILNCNFRN